MARWRGLASAVVVLAIGIGACACSSDVVGSSTIRTDALAVSPFEPSNSVWYSAATLKAERPFARWEQERDRIQLVTWPRTCDDVPVAIAFRPGAPSIDVETGALPAALGSDGCKPGHVLTTTFDASRLLHRDHPTTLVLGHQRVTLPRAPAMIVEPVSSTTVSASGRPHPLRQEDRPLPQYSVRDYPWALAAPVSPSSRTITIGWIGGTCQRNSSIAYVVETASTVTIDTALAPPPIRPLPPTPGRDTVCSGVGIGLTSRITLTRPLGSRTLLQHQYAPRPADLDAY